MSRSVKPITVFVAASCFIFVQASASVSSSSAIEQLNTLVTTGRFENNLKAKLDRYLNKAASELGFSGSVLVAKGKRRLLDKGYGWVDIKKTSPIKSDTKFYIASISKQFTAAAILKLEEQGHLSVEDTISKHLKDVPPDKAEITIHQLLTHTSGLAQNYAADGIANRGEAVRAIFKEPLKNPPGEKFGYTNDGYNLLAVIIEIASGKTYESFLRQHLLKPAGMSQTGFWGDSKGEKLIAGTVREIAENIKLPNWGFRGATGMFSTTGDLYKWQRALFANKVLEKISREKLLTSYVVTPRGGYGYGWFISQASQGRDVIWTAGSEDFGHNAIIKTYLDGTVIIVASNAGNISNVPARDVISAELERIIYDNSITNTKGNSEK